MSKFLFHKIQQQIRGLNKTIQCGDRVQNNYDPR